MTMTRKQCEQILSTAINASQADDTFVVLNAMHNNAMQIVANSMGIPVAYEDLTLQISVRFGAKYATVSLNSGAGKDIADAMARAKALALQMPDSPEIVPFPESTVVLESPIHLHSLTDLGNARRADIAHECISACEEADLLSTGSLTVSDAAVAIGTSNGLFLYQPSFHFHSQFRVFTTDGLQTGFQETYSHAADIESEALIGTAIKKCLAWSDPVDLWNASAELKERGIDTVFEPRALAEIMKLFIGQFSSDAIQQDQSFLRKLDGSSFIGNRMFPKEIGLSSNPFSDKAPSVPFTYDGIEVRPTSWIKNGVIEHVAISRYEAFRNKRMAIAPPTNLIMEGNNESLDNIIAGTERGLLLSGFADLSLVDYVASTMRGSTRDGLFLIEDGEIAAGVKNLVFQESAMKLLEKFDRLGKQSLVHPAGTPFPMFLPVLKTSDVKYSGPSGII